jgi:hypothetical protein
MLKRLLFGFVKGWALGLLVGAIFHFALGWPVTPGLSGYLIAMGAGATAGIVAGRPPWQREAWLEGALKAVVGLLLGLGLHWLARTYAPWQLPFELLGAPEGTPWTDAPLLYAPVVAAFYGALVELDNAPGAAPRPSRPGAVAETRPRVQ